MDPAPKKKSQDLLFDPFAEELVEDPFPHYDRLRSAAPVYWDAMLKAWVLTRYEEVRQVLCDDTFEVTELPEAIGRVGDKIGRDYGAIAKAVGTLPFFEKGERHRRDRRTVGRVLTRTPLRQLEPVIEDFARTLVADLSSRSEFDAATDYAAMLPAQVLGHILGLPASDAPFLLDLVVNFTRVLDLMPTSFYDQLNPKVVAALNHLSQRTTEAAAEKRDSGLSIIYEDAPFEGEAKLAEAAVIALDMFMVGTETTSSLIGSCIDRILQSAELYAQARANPALAPQIVTEVVRLESPVQRSLRIALEERVIAGQRIKPGEQVMLLLGAANRDPAEFAEPADLDVQRKDSEHVAFGAGKHVCVGMNLAQLEGRIAVEQFVRMPMVEPARPKIRYPGKTIRRVASLPVRFVGPS